MTRDEIVLRLRQINIDMSGPDENLQISIALSYMCALILRHHEGEMAAALSRAAEESSWIPDDLEDMVIK